MSRRTYSVSPCPSCGTNRVFNRTAEWWQCPACDRTPDRRVVAAMRVEQARNNLGDE